MRNYRVTQTRRMKSCLSSGWQGKGFSRSWKPFRLPRKLQHQPRSRGMLLVEHQGFSWMRKSAIVRLAGRQQEPLTLWIISPHAMSWPIFLLIRHIGIEQSSMCLPCCCAVNL